MARSAKTKTCPQCPKDKGPQPLSAFNKNARAKDGCQSWCRTCQQARPRARQTSPKKSSRRASTRPSPAPTFVIGRTGVPEALRAEIREMAWAVLRKQLKRLKKPDQRAVRMYALAEGVAL